MNMHSQAQLNKSAQEIWEDFSLSFTPAVREVVEFAKHIPGFSTLSQHDQVTLLKAGTFEVSLTTVHFETNQSKQQTTNIYNSSVIYCS